LHPLLPDVAQKAMKEDAEGLVFLSHGLVDYRSNESRLAEIQDLQGWGVLLPYLPDTSRQRAMLTTLGRRVLGMLVD
jgi:hypothetical protein